jgi:ribosomal subunit interface protein
MQVIVRSRNARIESRLRTIAERKVARLERIARDASRAEVDFLEERNPRIAGRHSCAVILHLRDGRVTAHAAAAAPEAALDLVIDKLRHQVDRRKDRRVRRAHAPRRRGAAG